MDRMAAKSTCPRRERCDPRPPALDQPVHIQALASRGDGRTTGSIAVTTTETFARLPSAPMPNSRIIACNDFPAGGRAPYGGRLFERVASSLTLRP